MFARFLVGFSLCLFVVEISESGLCVLVGCRQICSFEQSNWTSRFGTLNLYFLSV